MIRLAVALGIAFVFFAGCAAVEPVLQDVGVRGAELTDAPGLAAAVADVWTGYSRTDTPPRVLLVTGPDLTCTDPSSRNPGFAVLLASGPACREGYTLLPFAVSVAYHGQPWSQSALAHELEHVALIRNGQGTPLGDPGHATAGFQLGGAVDQANARLSVEGL